MVLVKIEPKEAVLFIKLKQSFLHSWDMGGTEEGSYEVGVYTVCLRLCICVCVYMHFLTVVEQECVSCWIIWAKIICKIQQEYSIVCVSYLTGLGVIIMK